MCAALKALSLALTFGLCAAVPTGTSPLDQVKTLVKTEPGTAINLATSDFQKLSLAGKCFLSLIALFFVCKAVQFLVREISAKAKQAMDMGGDLLGKGKDLAGKVPGVGAISGAVSGATGAVTGAVSGVAGTVGGAVGDLASKVSGGDAVIGAVGGAVSGATGAVGAVGSGATGLVTGTVGTTMKVGGNLTGSSLSLFDRIFTDERVEKGEQCLNFVPTFSILMIFVMFRAKEQGILSDDGVVVSSEAGEAYLTAQTGMLLGTFGIWLKAMDIFGIRITCEAIPDLSQVIGYTFTYLGFAAIIYAMFYAKDPEKKMSVAAQCIVALTSLVFIIQMALQFLQQKDKMASALTGDEATENTPLLEDTEAAAPVAETSPEEAAALAKDVALSAVKDPKALLMGVKNINPFDQRKLIDAKNLCLDIPVMCLVFFYAHMRVLELSRGKTIQEYALVSGHESYAMLVWCIYGATAGIFMQTMATLLIRDCNEALAELMRLTGFLCTYAGLSGVALFLLAIMGEVKKGGSTTTTSVAIALTLLSAFLVLNAVLAVIKACLAKRVSEKSMKIMKDCLDTLGLAFMISMILLYMHYRSFDITSGKFYCKMTSVCVGGAMLATGSVAAQMAFHLISSAPAFAADFMTFLKGNAQLALYIGFSMILYSAITLEVPSSSTYSLTSSSLPVC